MTKINLAGPYLWAWGLWHVAWLAGFVLVPLVGPGFAADWFRILYAAFLPLEVSGAYVNGQRHDRRARTMSAWRQWLASQGRPNQPGWLDDVLSWRGVAGASGVLDAAVMGIVVGSSAQAWTVDFVGPEYAAAAGTVIGMLWGLGLALWLVPHFGRSDLYG